MFKSRGWRRLCAGTGTVALWLGGCGVGAPSDESQVIAARSEPLSVASPPSWCNGYPGDSPFVYATAPAFSLWNLDNANDASNGYVIDSSPGTAIVENFDSYADNTDITSLMPNVQVTSGLVTAKWINSGQYKRAFIDVPTAAGEQLRAIFKQRSATDATKWRRFSASTTEAKVIVSGIVEAEDNPHVALMARYNTSYDTYYASLRFEKVPGDATGQQRRLYAYVQRKLCGKYVQFGGGASTSKKYLDTDHTGAPLAVPVPNFTDGTAQTFSLRFVFDPTASGHELKFYVNWLGQAAFNTEYGWNRPIADFSAALTLSAYSPQPISQVLDAGVGGIRSDFTTFYLDDFKLY